VIIAGFLFLGGALATRSQAQIVIYIPNGVTQTYSAIPNENHIFVSDGTGTVRFTGNNGGFNKSLVFDGASVIILADASFSNIGEIRLNTSRLFVPKGDFNQINDDVSIYLDSGVVDFNYGFTSPSSVKRVGSVILAGGDNGVGLNPPSFVADLPRKDHALIANELIRQSPQATFDVSVYVQRAGWSGDGPIAFTSALAFMTAPEMINGIMPYSVHNGSKYLSGDRYFSTAVLKSGHWYIEPAGYSIAGQSSWGSSVLNISLDQNSQTLSANRMLNSLRIQESHSVNLAGYTLSINSGAILTVANAVILPTNSNSLLGGTITTGGGRYFFYVYSDRLTVSSVISGSGKELIKSGFGALRFNGAQPNSYTGDTYVHSGVLELNKSPKANSVRNVIVRGNFAESSGGVNLKNAELRIMQSHQIADSATVTLDRGAVFAFAGEGGVGLTEKIHTLQVERRAVINFAGGTLARANVLETTQVLLPTADDTLFIRNWIEFSDYFLVSRAFAPNSAALSRIWFEGWDPGAKLRDYNTSHWEIVPFAAPEPATYGALLGTLGIAVIVWGKRQNGRRTSECAAK